MLLFVTIFGPILEQLPEAYGIRLIVMMIAHLLICVASGAIVAHSFKWLSNRIKN
jgi:hypothetical protein